MSNHVIDFGKTAVDYRQYRQGFPEEFFVRLYKWGIGLKSQRILDIGTGTGTVARGLRKLGCEVVAMDPSENLLQQARKIDEELEIREIKYVIGTAEDTKQAAHFFDVVIAGQCWHWFDALKAIQEIKRVLKPDGKLIIAHYDWLPAAKSVPELTEKLILKYSPHYQFSGENGFYLQWITQLMESGFHDIQTYSFDVIADYTHEAWRGRIRASAGVGASLPKEEVFKFDEEHQQALNTKFSEEILKIPHRCFTIIATASVLFQPEFSIINSVKDQPKP